MSETGGSAIDMRATASVRSSAPRHRRLIGALFTVAALTLSAAAPAWADTPGAEPPAGEVETTQTPTPDDPSPGDSPESTPPPTETPFDPTDPQAEPGDGDESIDPDAGLVDGEEGAEFEDQPEATEESIEPRALAPLSASATGYSKRLSVTPQGVLGDTPNRRISGADRFATAVAISKHAYDRADTVVIATGLNYPDSLSAAPLAASLRAPLLLTMPTSLPKVTRDEIKRLKPKTIIVVGGTGAVNASVERALKPLAAKTERLSGKDRYLTSVAISKRGWPGKTGSAFIATGESYADALAAGAAAGKAGVPVILVQGRSKSAPTAVRTEVNRLSPQRLYIAGGTGVVSSAMQKSVAGSRAVTRFAGKDRFETSAKIANGIFTSPTRATYFASGLNFADALTGAAAAGAEGSPLLLSWGHCIPSSVYSASDNRKANNTFLLGGSGVLGGAVRNGNECMQKPKSISSSDWAAAQKLYSYINYYRTTAGKAGARVSDASRGTPAQTWSRRSSVSLNSGLKSAQPWVRYEGVVRSKAGGDRAKAIYNRFMKESQPKQWVHRASAGQRTFVSVGYHTKGNTSYGTLYVGTGLK